jgi:sugar lactone lactonase YvrE
LEDIVFRSWICKVALRLTVLRQRSRISGYGIAVCLFATICFQCYGQTSISVSYFSALRPVATTGGFFAVDVLGNIYLMSPDSSSVLKETLFEGTYIQSTVCAASAGDVVVVGDDGGDVFRLSGGTLYEEVNQMQGPSYQSEEYTEKAIYNTTDNIASMAVDTKDNVYILDSTLNELLRLTPTSSGYVQSFVATRLTGATSIGVDANGNVYALEVNGSSGTVEKFVNIGTGYTGSEFTSGLTVGSGSEIAVDPSGDVYLQQDTFKITEIQASTGKQIFVPCPPDGCLGGESGGSSYNYEGFLAGPDGNFYFGYERTIYKETFQSPNLGTVDVGNTASAYLAFQTNVGSAGLSATVSGPPFADYGVGSFACVGGDILEPEMPFCYVDVTFTPPGLALYQGTLTLTESSTVSPTPPVTVKFQGAGAAPQIGFSPAPQSIILSSAAPYNLQGPEGIAVDGKGNLYIADTGGKQVLKETLSSGQYTQTVIANAQNGLKNPIGVAVDTNGNVYIADPMVGILKETLTSSGYTQSTAIAAGGPLGVAVDASGILYLVNGTSVIKAVPNGGPYTETTLLSSLTPGNSAISTQGIAVDSSGNVYVTDTGNQRVIKFSPANGSYTQSTVASGFGFPWGIAVDFAGNVYVGDEGGGVYKESLSNGAYSQTLMNGSIAVAYGVAVDGSENVYAATITPAYIYEIPAVQTTTLSFASTPVGATSPDSPQTLTVQNVGTYPLTFTMPGTGTNPSISAGFTIGTAGTCLDLFTSSTGAELMPGGSCTYQISFAPTTAGAISGSLTFTDNSDNVAGATQIITLLGAATTAAPTVQISATSLNFNSEPVGSTSTAQTVTLTNSGTAALAISTISASGDFAETQTCGSSVAAGSSCTVSVTFTPTAAGNRSGTLTISDNASGSPQTVVLSGTGTTPVSPTPAVTLSPTSLAFTPETDGTTSAAQTITLTNTGSAALSITSIAASGDFAETQNCGSSVAAGTSCTISVTFTPTAGGSRTGTLTITDNSSGSPQTVSLTGIGSTVTQTPASGSLSISSTGGSATDAIQLSSAGGFSGTVNLTCTVTYQGPGSATDAPTCSLSPAQAQVASGSTVSTTLTIATTASGSARLFNPFPPIGGGALAAVLFFIGVPRRRWRGWSLLAVLGVVIAGTCLGCGGGSNGGGSGNNPPPNAGTTTGNYSVTVKATSGTMVSSVSIPLTVQ